MILVPMLIQVLIKLKVSFTKSELYQLILRHLRVLIKVKTDYLNDRIETVEFLWSRHIQRIQTYFLFQYWILVHDKVHQFRDDVHLFEVFFHLVIRLYQTYQKLKELLHFTWTFSDFTQRVFNLTQEFSDRFVFSCRNHKRCLGKVVCPWSDYIDQDPCKYLSELLLRTLINGANQLLFGWNRQKVFNGFRKAIIKDEFSSQIFDLALTQRQSIGKPDTSGLIQDFQVLPNKFSL